MGHAQRDRRVDPELARQVGLLHGALPLLHLHEQHHAGDSAAHRLELGPQGLGLARDEGDVGQSAGRSGLGTPRRHDLVEDEHRPRREAIPARLVEVVEELVHHPPRTRHRHLVARRFAVRDGLEDDREPEVRHAVLSEVRRRDQPNGFRGPQRLALRASRGKEPTSALARCRIVRIARVTLCRNTRAGM